VEKVQRCKFNGTGRGSAALMGVLLILLNSCEDVFELRLAAVQLDYEHPYHESAHLLLRQVP